MELKAIVSNWMTAGATVPMYRYHIQIKRAINYWTARNNNKGLKVTVYCSAQIGAKFFTIFSFEYLVLKCS